VAIVPFEIGYRDTAAHLWVVLRLQGEQGLPTASIPTVAELPPYHVWTFTVNGHQAGSLVATFIENAQPPATGTAIASCEISVVP
jgi:hypothetical protein